MSTPVSTSVNHRRYVSRADRVPAYQRGRICGHPGCATILSIYNPAMYCSAHLTQAPSRPTRGATHAVREVSCRHCGISFKTANPRRKYCGDRCRMAAFARRKRAHKRAAVLAAGVDATTRSSGPAG
jgi:predicted nucleic acid-binding Zn ribbon protein